MILIAMAAYFAVALLFVVSIALAAARPMPKPENINDKNEQSFQRNPVNAQ